MTHNAALDWMNFLLADVRGGLGPYVSVYLVTEAHWDAGTVGVVLTVSGLIGIALHAPLGALIDATRAKREILVIGVVALSACALAIAWSPTLPVVLAADIVMAVLGAVFAPAVAAITLGIVEEGRLAARLGRNAAFDRAGNLFIAGLAGIVGTAFGQKAIFFLVPFFAIWSVLAILAIPGGAIDHHRARGFATARLPTARPETWRELASRRPLLILGAVAVLFHLANASMLPLLAQKLALAHPGREAALTSGAIVVAQLTMVPVSLLVVRADRIGRRPLLLMATGALVARGILLTLSDSPAWLLAVQTLDGVGIGLFDALLPLVLADIVRGSGRYNIARGLIGTVQGIGGSVSQAVGGIIAMRAGYDLSFVALSAIALVPFALVLVAMPETRPAARAPGAAAH
jgi:MFS family permease